MKIYIFQVQNHTWTETRDNMGESSVNIPLVNRLLVLLVGFHKPFPNANKTAIHEAAFQQVMDGFKQQCTTFIGETILPKPIIFS